MFQVNQEIFKAYDIRGIYGKDFDDAFVQELANKVAVHFGAQKVVVARDDRVSSQSLVKHVVEGIRQAGLRTIFINIATTPLFYFSVHAARADLGIMVTASHNPGEYNGLKVVGPEANILSGDDLRLIFNRKEVSRRQGGIVDVDDFAEDYIHKIVRVGNPGQLASLPIAFDAPSAVKKNLSLLVKHSSLNIQPKADLNVIFDQDADRIRFSDNGQDIPAEFLFIALVEHFGFSSVVYDFRFSRAVRQKLTQLHVMATASRVGRLFVHEAMKVQNADLGAEMSGHFYLKDFGFFECPEMLLVMTLKMMRDRNFSLIEITEPYNKLFKSPEVVFDLKSEWQTVKEKLQAKYSSGTQSEFDGLTVEYPDWWFNIRPSHTEPVLRLVAEANKQDLLKEKVAELISLIG